MDENTVDASTAIVTTGPIDGEARGRASRFVYDDCRALMSQQVSNNDVSPGVVRDD
jgi:hypothetical protein